MISLFIGRFQPFHNGHLYDIKEALKFSDKLIIGIGSSDKSDTIDNPFSFVERKEMIEKVIKKENLSDIDIISIPDIHDDKKWASHVRSIAGNFDLAYTGNDWVKRLLSEEGIVIKDIQLIEGISATSIRKMIYKNEHWQKLVPIEIVEYIKKIEGVNRIKRINGLL